MRTELQYIYLDLLAHQEIRKHSNLSFSMNEITLNRYISMKNVIEFESCCNISYVVNMMDEAHKPITIKTPCWTLFQ
jgi:hypothetical protein